MSNSKDLSTQTPTPDQEIVSKITTLSKASKERVEEIKGYMRREKMTHDFEHCN